MQRRTLLAVAEASPRAAAVPGTAPPPRSARRAGHRHALPPTSIAQADEVTG